VTGDGRDLVGVRFDAALGDDVPRELAPGDPKGSFLRVQLNVEPPEVVQGFSRPEMRLPLFRDFIMMSSI
jgi:hypothetical protein